MILLGLVMGILISSIGLIQGMSAGLLALALLSLIPQNSEFTTGLISGLVGTTIWVNAIRDKSTEKHVLIPIATLAVSLALIVLISRFTNTDLITALISLSKQLAVFGIMVWFLCHINKTNWWVYILYGLWGLIVFRLDSTRGSTWTPMLLMLGMISLPTVLTKMPEPAAPTHQDHTSLITGSLVGIVSGLFIGIGSSSIVNIVKKTLNLDEEETSLNTPADTNNSLTGFLLLLGFNSSRSAEASLAQVLELDPTRSLISLAISLTIGYVIFLKASSLTINQTLIRLLAISSLGLILFSGSPVLAILIVAGSAALTLLNQQINPKDSQPIFATLASSILLG